MRSLHPAPAVLAVLICLVSLGSGTARLFADPPVKQLTIAPGRIELNGSNRRQHFAVTMRDEQGRSIDVTRRVRLTVADPKIAKIEGNRVLAVGDGQTTLEARLGELSRAIPVRVGREESAKLHFGNDILPVLSKLGCNSGGCHGKQSGQNGFKLSVFGFDPKADYDALVKEGRGRRVFPADPARSLLIAKATARVAHGGGQRTPPESADARLLAEWISRGMPWGDDDAPTLRRIQVEPADRVLAESAEQQLLVTAVYSDGRHRDVTDAAAYTSNMGNVARVDQSGAVRTGKVAGEAAITINYMGKVAAARVIIPRGGKTTAGRTPTPLQISSHPLDQLVAAKLSKLNIAPSGRTDDATFLRRLHLTSCGRGSVPMAVK